MNSRRFDRLVQSLRPLRIQVRVMQIGSCGDRGRYPGRDTDVAMVTSCHSPPPHRGNITYGSGLPLLA
jgi:hypothetical protein